MVGILLVIWLLFCENFKLGNLVMLMLVGGLRDKVEYVFVEIYMYLLVVIIDLN